MKKFFLVIGLSILIINGYSANRVVTNLNDNGPGSFRDQILQAVNGDTISFNSSLRGKTIQINTTIVLNPNVVIQGFVSGDQVTINGKKLIRILSVGATTTTTINGIQFEDGNTSSGGAIINNGVLELNYCRFFNNFSQVSNAAAHGGGAIYNNTGAQIVINNCEFSGNRVSAKVQNIPTCRGGAIFNRGSSVVINNSSLYDNHVITDPPSNPNNPNIARGGALFSNAGTVNINSSTFSRNLADCEGLNSLSTGGAIYASSSLTVNHSTFWGNKVDAQTEIGNGIYVGSNFVLYNTILANPGAGKDLFVQNGATSSGNNIIMDTINCKLNLKATDLVTDPKLDTLKYNNGAFTKTHALRCGSPAYEAGNNSSAPSKDQANQTRKVGDKIDIGSFEAQGPMNVSVSITASDTTFCIGDTVQLTGTMDVSGTYQWNNGLSQVLSHRVHPTTVATYIFIGTIPATGCADTAYLQLEVISLPPKPVISSVGLALKTGVYATYQWFLDGIPIPNATSDTYTPLANGTYTVQVTNNGGCENSSSGYSVNTVGGNYLSLSEVLVYPNPANQFIRLASKAKSDMEITNAQGVLIAQFKGIQALEQIDISQLPIGLYLVQIKNLVTLEQSTTKLIKE